MSAVELENGKGPPLWITVKLERRGRCSNSGAESRMTTPSPEVPERKNRTSSAPAIHSLSMEASYIGVSVK